MKIVNKAKLIWIAKVLIIKYGSVDNACWSLQLKLNQSSELELATTKAMTSTSEREKMQTKPRHRSALLSYTQHQHRWRITVFIHCGGSDVYFPGIIRTQIHLRSHPHPCRAVVVRTALLHTVYLLTMADLLSSNRSLFFFFLAFVRLLYMNPPPAQSSRKVHSTTKIIYPPSLSFFN